MVHEPANERTAIEHLADANEAIVHITREAVVEGDKLAQFGLDPEWWLAAVPTELSVAGIVNKNGRIYPEDEFDACHERLNERAGLGYVSGLKGHPMLQAQDGDREFDIAVRLLQVETYRDESGTLRSRGVVAFPRTSVGQDLYVLWRGGLELGTSSRARAMFVPHLINESSPHYAKNPEHRGETVMLAKYWTLGMEGTYDMVLNPSASTFLNSEAREAALRFETCPQLPTEENMADENAVVDGQKDAETLQSEIVAQAIEAYRESDPFAKLTDEQRADLLAAVEKAGETPVAEALVALESAKTALEAQVAAVTAERDALAAEKTEAARVAELNAALEAATADYRCAAQVQEVVAKELIAFESVDALNARVTFLKSIFDSVGAAASGVSRTATESIDDPADVPDSTAGSALRNLIAQKA